MRASWAVGQVVDETRGGERAHLSHMLATLSFSMARVRVPITISTCSCGGLSAITRRAEQHALDATGASSWGGWASF